MLIDIFININYKYIRMSYWQLPSQSKERVDGMLEDTLKIKKRGDDGYKVISVRIKEDTLEALDRVAAETNYSRNELINLMLKYGVEHVEIE